jgi:hypothetical protein
MIDQMPSIDTGLGLERTAAVLQGEKSNYDTDLFRPIIKKIETLAPKESDKSGLETSFRAISDHARAMTFLIAEGILPSNEGGGYVLRRIMRRASRHGKKLGIDGPFLHKISHAVVRLMKEPYPELSHQESFVSETIRTEEERFLETLERGMEIFYQEVSKLKKAGQRGIPGEVAFRLYDTFGFPMDMTRDMAREEGFDLPELTTGFRKKLRGTIPELWDWLRNPIDASLFIGTPLVDVNVLEWLSSEEGSDLLVANLTQDDPLPEDIWGSVLAPNFVNSVMAIKNKGRPIVCVIETGEIGLAEMERWKWRAIAEREDRLPTMAWLFSLLRRGRPKQ